MSTVVKELPVPPEAVWAVLADPDRYPDWVVGARRIRAADGSWPAEGAVLHHELSGGIEDSTTVLESEAPHRLVLRARARPAGVARVTITVTPTASGSEVEMDEVAVSGILTLVPDCVLALFVKPRNLESLRRLGELARVHQS